MAWAAKPLVKKVCNFCGEDVWKKRSKFSKKFKYCSNACKWAAKRQQIPHNKLQPHERIHIKCAVETCPNVKSLTPFWFNRRKTHFCSVKCHHYYIAKQYKLDLKELQTKRDEAAKRSIWRIGFY